MPRQILDYSAVVEDSRSYIPSGDIVPVDPALFDAVGTCPFCKAGAPMVADEKSSETIAALYDHYIHKSAWQCACGWWQTYRQDWRWDSPYEWGAEQTRSAVLRRYDPADSEVPLTSLRKALLRNPNLIDNISRKKTELLVGSVFSDFFACEARVIGKSRDGGIDLVLILGEREILVQVKHRDKGSRAWEAEPVTTVREFLGATLLARRQHAVLVTTAQRFSRPAREAAARAVALRHVQQYDLFDFNGLIHTLRLAADQIPDHWRHNYDFQSIVP